jgi:hypothetical protein
LKETVPTPPNVTFDDHMTVFRGDREIRLLYLGRGHSDTDVIVYLPKEKIVATGDFFEGPVTGALNFGFHDEWANNLEKLKALDFETGRARARRTVQRQRADLVFSGVPARPLESDEDAHDQKVPVADAAKRIDLSAHREHYRNVNGPGFQQATVARIYQVLDQRGGTQNPKSQIPSPKSKGPAQSRRWDLGFGIWVLGFFLAAVGFAVFWNSLPAPFTFDDDHAIVINEQIRHISTVAITKRSEDRPWPDGRSSA